ncbi:MAG: hypothetical protein ACWGQW_16860 [bacterium]
MVVHLQRGAWAISVPSLTIRSTLQKKEKYHFIRDPSRIVDTAVFQKYDQFKNKFETKVSVLNLKSDGAGGLSIKRPEVAKLCSEKTAGSIPASHISGYSTQRSKGTNPPPYPFLTLQKKNHAL